MQKWYCQDCGATTYSKHKPNIEGCSKALATLRVELQMGKKNYKFPSNARVHQWFDADEYENEFGSLPTTSDIQQRIYAKEDTKRQLNNSFKEQFGRDFFLPNGRASESRSEEPQKTFTEELQEIKEQATSFIKSIKSLFSK